MNFCLVGQMAISHFGRRFHLKIYRDGVLKEKIRRFFWRDENKFIITLSGINVLDNGEVEPVYQFLVEFWRQGGFWIITRKFLLIFATRYPFVIFKLADKDVEVLEDE